VLAHPLLDGRTAVLHRDVAATAASVAQFDKRDSAAWYGIVREWDRLGDPLLRTLLSPFPPIRSAACLARRLGPADGLRFARFAVLTMRRYAMENFHGAGAVLLLAGNGLHTDLGPDQTGSALFGWLLAMLGQQVGYPVPRGGAGRLTAALVDRLHSRGGVLHCGMPVTQVLVRGDRAVGVRLQDGSVVTARRAVLADVAATELYRRLLDPQLLPARLRRDLDRFDWDGATVKVDWALSGPIPWRNAEVGGAGTVHLGGDLAEIATYSHELAQGAVPEHPFLVVGQMTTADPDRSPRGTESAWAYTHLPVHRDWSDPAVRKPILVAIEDRMETYAPGFRDLVTARHVAWPSDLQGCDANLVNGAINGGTSAFHQQLIFRPLPGLGRPETHLAGLYLASASAHPGGGVHGACGANAAQAALRARTTGRLVGAATRALARAE
jgi:phytoene dehydrogenase-like protein